MTFLQNPTTIRLLTRVVSMLILMMTLVSIKTRAQTDISVYTIQNMSFGAFATGNSGGTVVISSAGVRSVTGSVVPLNFGLQYGQAIFEIEAPAGTIISILNGPDAMLTGSNGGTMSLRTGNTDPASPFNTTAIPPARTLLNMGASLTVGNATVTPPGSYTGTINITFNYQ